MRPLCPQCGGEINPKESRSYMRALVPVLQGGTAIIAVVCLGLYLFLESPWAIGATGVATVLFMASFWLIPLPQFICTKCKWQGRL